MADKNTSDFREIVSQIVTNKILLPDFQRDFVWTEEEKQKKIIASVLTRMPVGSILLLASAPDGYSSKVIGCDIIADTSKIEGEVEFLLDGQQRITVLTNVFSNIIHEQSGNMVSLLTSPALKRRFFLRIPRWEQVYHEEVSDWFNVKHLEFPLMNPDTDDPEFLTSNILPFIECLNFTSNDGKPYNPKTPPSTELDNFCVSYQEGYLIPLFLLIADGKKKKQIELRYTTIINLIATSIQNEIENEFFALPESERTAFLDGILEDHALVSQFDDELLTDDETKSALDDILGDRATIWKQDIMTYLNSCLSGMFLGQIHVQSSKRDRAIDIYENLNLGGVSLSTFDLVMARVATRDNQNFKDRIIRNIQSEKAYPLDVMPDKIKAIFSSVYLTDSSASPAELEKPKFNASMFAGVQGSGRELNAKYIDAFLDVLGIACNNPELKSNGFKMDYIKKNKILDLKADDIHNNCEKVIKAIDRAMFFFETRCGIRRINEINYSLMTVLVASVFLKDEFWKDAKVHDLLEAWYWSVIFSGEYDKDQNANMLAHLKKVFELLNKESTDINWLTSMKENVLSMTNFSDKKLLLMEKVEEDRTPKNMIRNFVCQFLLAQTYTDMFDDSMRVSVFCSKADELEAHHIIPLGSTKKYGEVTAKLRGDNGNICNSPVNFCFITKEANKEISSDPIEVYAGKITNQAKTVLHISAYITTALADTEDKVRGLLSNRFDALQGDIRNRIDGLLIGWTP